MAASGDGTRPSRLTAYARRALAARFDSVLEVRRSTIEGAGKGVFAVKRVPKGTQLPYLGRRVVGEAACAEVTDFAYVMEVYDAEPRTLIVGDGKYSRSRFNFAYRVNEAHRKAEKNTRITTSKGWAKRLSPMCLVTTRDVEAGEELLAWYNAGRWIT